MLIVAEANKLQPRMRWWGWGVDGHDSKLTPAAQRLVRSELGAESAPRLPVHIDAVELPESQLTQAACDNLAMIVGTDHVRYDRLTRISHAAGKSYPDAVRLRAGDASFAPDAVVYPGDHDEVAALLHECSNERIAVVPFGGGTSVVGGVEALRGPFDAVVSVDTARMDAMISLDPMSEVATFGAGMLGPQVERALDEHNLTLGHFPQSFEFSTVGGWVATRSAGQASTGYGRIDELVVSLRFASPAGEIAPRLLPATAAGPDLRELLVGSEGVLGMVTEATLRVRPKPAQRRYEGWSLPGFARGADALRALEQAGVAPDVTRLSDEEETRINLNLGARGRGAKLLKQYLKARGRGNACLAIVGFEGQPSEIKGRRERAREILSRHGGVPLGAAPGTAWERGRYHGPYLRDELLRAGVMVDTLETATTWTNLMWLYRSVRDALRSSLSSRGTPPLVMCHISHVYPTGASLYFTFLARQEAGAELEQWHAAKSAASNEIANHAGTITHHHAVGRDHARWFANEVGPLGIDVLRAAKATLDPVGIMNPGKLVEVQPLPGG